MARTFLLIPLLMLFVYGCAPVPQQQAETLFFPELPNEPRMQFLTSISSDLDLGKRRGGFDQFLLGDPGARRLGRPHDFAPAPGRMYVSDTAHNMVLILDYDKKELRALATDRAARLRQPLGITVADGLLYVVDGAREQVLVFDHEEKYIRLYGSPEIFERPMDVAVYGDRVYVVDFFGYDIKVFDRDSGELLRTIGERGREEGQLDRPTHVKVDEEGNIFVTDSLNFRIQKFDPEGNYLHEIGFPGDVPGAFARPKGFDISQDGFLFAVDAAFENVQVFLEEKQFLVYFFGSFGNAPGFMYLPSPLIMDYDNVDFFKQYVDKDFEVQYLLYVGNQLGNYKINVYGFGKWIGAPLN